MTDKHFAFTKRSLEALPPAPAGKRVDYFDTKTPGLTLRVTHAGSKAFTFLRRIKGKQERITIGKFPDVTIEQAQKEAKKLAGQVASGTNPAQEKREIRQEITLGELFTTYLDNHAKLHKSSWESDVMRYDSHLAHWSKRKLSDIRRSEVQALHAKIAAEKGLQTVIDKKGRSTRTRIGGPGTANHAIRLLRAMYNKATLWGYEGSNPAQGIKQFPTQKRDRFLEADEMPRLFQALAEEPNEIMKDFFLALLLTGARRSNVMAMSWEEINLERQTWRIPKTKTGDSQTIPLVPAMLELLERRKASQADSPWVFPGPGESGHLESPNNAWTRLVKRAGITDPRGTTIHDLRRSLGSWQAATGANLSVISKTLGHKNVSTTAIYARLNIDPVRASMEKATDAMLAAGGISAPAQVIELKKRKA